MKLVRLVPLENASPRFVDAARDAIARAYRAPVDLLKRKIDLAGTYHSERNQYHSTAILEQLMKIEDRGDYLVAVAPFDLYIPILTFVFGEAQLGGRCAVVSYHRMTQEFYGLPADDRTTAGRIAKTAVHELGHVVGLTHCDDYECVMAPSHSVEWLDLKGSAICEECRDRMYVAS